MSAGHFLTVGQEGGHSCLPSSQPPAEPPAVAMQRELLQLVADLARSIRQLNRRMNAAEQLGQVNSRQIAAVAKSAQQQLDELHQQQGVQS